MQKKIKAVALISGGLDSLLAAKVIMGQNIHVEGLNFYSGFFGEGAKVVTPKRQQNSSNIGSANWIAEQLKIKLHVINIFDDFKTIFLKPRYGYGANLNPCLDCKICIVKKAKEWILANDFDFIISGEVIGQRPMSQRKDMLPIVQRNSTAEDLLIRPLSAKLLPITKPEREGWVDRKELYNFNGRSRKPQIALANQFGFSEIPQPAGGCLLTDTNFCDRLKDLWQNRENHDYSLEEVDLLKVGRHIRPKQNFKMIIGREEAENIFLEKYKDRYIHLFCTSCPGPFVIIDGYPAEEDLEIAAKITAQFSKDKHQKTVEITTVLKNGKTINHSISPID